MLTIACVLSDGPKRDYAPEHVKRLMRQVEGKISQPYRFVCLTDQEVPCERIGLHDGWEGWWAKVELFRPGLFRSGSMNRVLYLDLDVDIVGDLEEMIRYPSPFTIIGDWNRPGFNSSVMLWDADSGITDALFNDFTLSVTRRLKGDQGWIAEKMPKSKTFPKWWCLSFRAHIQGRGFIPPSCKIIVYHGLPKPWGIEHAA